MQSQLLSIMAANFSYGPSSCPRSWLRQGSKKARVGGIGAIPQLLKLLAQELRDVQARVGRQKAFEIFWLLMKRKSSPVTHLLSERRMTSSA